MGAQAQGEVCHLTAMAGVAFCNTGLSSCPHKEGKSVMKVQMIPPAFSWASQAKQYAERGAPGLTLEQHMVEVDTGVEVFDVPADLAGPGISVVDCLLLRDELGGLVAILNHYDGKIALETADSVNLWVRPDRQREGIGKMMTREAMKRWPGVRLENQRYTRIGVHLLQSLIRDESVANRNTQQKGT
jgi:GNAT superfamily N-acetyltransferase